MSHTAKDEMKFTLYGLMEEFEHHTEALDKPEPHTLSRYRKILNWLKYLF